MGKPKKYTQEQKDSMYWRYKKKETPKDEFQHLNGEVKVVKPEVYDEYGELINKPERTLSNDQQHRIHQTKDMFDSECSLCQQDMKKHVKTYWNDDV